MKIAGIILCLLMLLCGIPEAQVIPICYGCEQPLGIGGMQSNYAFNTLDPTQIRYGLNIDTWTTPGSIRKRFGYPCVGDNNIALYGAWGNKNIKLNVSVGVGIKTHATYGLGQFCYTDSFSIGFQDNTISQSIFPYRDSRHDFTDLGDFTIYCDGKSIPSIFTQEQTFKVNDSVPDSTGWGPHFISMGLEAPGQLRAQVTSTAGSLNGSYQYALSFFHWKHKPGYSTVDYWMGDTAIIGEHGIPSASVYPHNQKVAVTLFENQPPFGRTTVGGYIWTYPDSTKALLLRKKLDGKQIWNIIDTLYYALDSQLVYIDSISDTISAVIDTASSRRGDSANTPIPGQFLLATDIDNIDTGSWRVAYSYYDPITGIESPLSRPMKVDGTGDSILATFAKGWTDSNRPKWIRVYQTINDVLLAGGGDTSVYYGIFQVRANDCFIGEKGVMTDSLVFGDTTRYGITWSDSQVVNGIDSTDLALINDTISVLHSWNNLRNAFGDPVTIPPHHYDCQIPFKDIEYYEGRLWGIGDPECPSCLYYSEVNAPPYSNVFNWSLSNVWDINEGAHGELIALKRAEGLGGEAMYAFKRNAIYLITGGANDLNVRLIKTGVGPINGKMIVKKDETIYFMSQNLRIYSLNGIILTDISSPIEDRVDSLFVSDENVYTYGVSFASEDHVKFYHTGAPGISITNGLAGYGLSYNIISKSWTFEQLGETGAYVPIGSFIYDTSSSRNNEGFIELLYSDTAMKLIYQSHTSFNDFLGSATGYEIPDWEVRFPFYGNYVDGWSINNFQLSLSNIATQSYLRYGVYDNLGNAEFTDAAIVSPTTNENTNVDLPFNEGKFLQLRFWMVGGETYTAEGSPAKRPQRFTIHSLTQYMRNMGNLGVQ